MLNKKWKACAVALVLSLATGTVSRADMIPWTYTTTVASDSDGTAVVWADNPGFSPGFASTFDENNQLPTHGVGSMNTTASRFVLGNIPGGSPFTMDGYTFTLHLTDDDSGASGDLAFRGAFDGDTWMYPNSLFHHFTGATEQSLSLGGNLYTVTLSYIPSPVSDFTTWEESGRIEAFIDVHGPQPAATPEPSTLGLAGFGGLCVIAAWRRRRGVAGPVVG